MVEQEDFVAEERQPPLQVTVDKEIFGEAVQEPPTAAVTVLDRCTTLSLKQSTYPHKELGR